MRTHLAGLLAIVGCAAPGPIDSLAGSSGPSTDSSPAGTTSEPSTSSPASSAASDATSTSDASSSSADEASGTDSSDSETTGSKPQYDPFGIEMIYPTTPGGEEWFMDMDDPAGDEQLFNYDETPSPVDGGYEIGARSRMSVYTSTSEGFPEAEFPSYDFDDLSEIGYWHEPNDWKNVEITGEYKWMGGDGPGITHYVRSEDHSSYHDGCGGSSYKNKIYFDGTSNLNKEMTHPHSFSQPHVDHPFGDLTDGEWFRFKAVIYNLPGDTGVKQENWLDPLSSNEWTKIAEFTDEGGWGDDGDVCGGQPDHIITWGGPMVTFRWDDVDIAFRHLSIREIEPPQSE